MSGTGNNDKSRLDQARDWVKDHPVTTAGTAIGALGGVAGAAGGAAAGGLVDKAYKTWQERQSDEDAS